MSDKAITFTARGQKWQAIFTASRKILPKTNDGLSDYDNKIISIRKTQKGAAAMGTLIHEFTHAYFPDVNEDVVALYEIELMALLEACGMVPDEWAIDEI